MDSLFIHLLWPVFIESVVLSVANNRSNFSFSVPLFFSLSHSLVSQSTVQPLSVPATHHTIAYLDEDNEKLGANHPGHCGFRVWTNCHFFFYPTHHSNIVQVARWEVWPECIQLLQQPDFNCESPTITWRKCPWLNVLYQRIKRDSVVCIG